MTPEDLKKIREAAEAATPGPWRSFYKRKYDEWHVAMDCASPGMNVGLFDDGCPTGEADARHIATSNPETVIQLVDEVVEARDWVNTVRRACREAMGNNSTFIDDDVARTIERLTKELAEAREALGKIDPLTQYSSGNPEAQLFAVQQIIRAFRKIDKIAGDV